jgi:dTMP kinase
MSNEPDRFESEEIAFHQRVLDGFLELARLDEKRFIVLDAEKPCAYVVQNQIRSVLKKRGRI